MKILSRHLERDGSGTITLMPECDEDLYHLYNLIQPEDLVRASTVRRIQSESSTGSIESHRMRLQLTLSVTKIDFEMSAGNSMSNTAGSGTDSGSEPPSETSTPMSSLVLGEAGQAAPLSGASQGQPMLHISGRVAEENDHVRTGSFHTLDIELQRKLSITKDHWDQHHLDILDESGEAGNTAEVGAVILGEGRAIVCLLTSHMTIVRQRIQVALPRKRAGAGYGSASASSGTAKLTERFNTQVYNAVIKLLSLPEMRVVLLASPGFWRESMYDYLLAEATRRNDKILMGSEGKRKLLKVHCATPHVHSLMEVLKSPEVSAQLQNTKFARENQLMDQFLRTLASDELRAWYGEKAVFLAANRGAIGTLLLSDALMRNTHPTMRKRWLDLCEQVKSYGGTSVFFSSLHESGRQLNGLGGVAALLTYPLDLEMVEEEEAEAAAEEQAKKQVQ
ncbi:Translation factor pelota [Malassezia pachydermatis]|uniref:Protein DOM34 homolog n=1 Tax=Malassezia pachydermatis TaxID=77020 RepID=A0A0M9VPY1_9BASI|nr:pelota protein [Malassezia pachydermatis]KOS14875.1 pelota protein [Malassezia pachydermatis]